MDSSYFVSKPSNVLTQNVEMAAKGLYIDYPSFHTNKLGQENEVYASLNRWNNLKRFLSIHAAV